MNRESLTRLWRPLVVENPLCVRLIGLTPVLACSDSFARAIPMSIVFAMVMTGTALLCSLSRHWVPAAHRLLLDLIIIASVISFIDIAVQRFALAAYMELGIYLPALAGTALLWAVAEESLEQKLSNAMKRAIWYAGVASVSMLLLTGVRQLLGLFSPLPGHAAGGLLLLGFALAANNVFLSETGQEPTADESEGVPQ